VATIDFPGPGRRPVPLVGLPFTTPGITYQQELAEQFTSVLGDVVSAAQYPLGAITRTFETP
jgi:5'-nucleotidase / UDP-sugar diphosphatase